MKDLLLLMSASSVFALTIPEEKLHVFDGEIEARQESATTPESKAVPTPTVVLTAKSLSTSNVSTLTGAFNMSSIDPDTIHLNGTNGSHWFKDYNFDKYTYSLNLCDFDFDCSNRNSDSDVEDGVNDIGNSSYPVVPNKSYPMHLNSTKRSVIVKRGDREIVPFKKSKVKAHKEWRISAQPYFGTLSFYRGVRKNWDRENFEFDREDDIHDPTVVNTQKLETTRGTVIEHPVELQVVGQFANWWAGGDEKREAAFIEQFERPLTAAGLKHLAKKYPWGKAAIQNAGKKGLTFGDVVFHALGSTANPGPNVVAHEGVNAAKEKFWAEHDARGEKARKQLWKDIKDQKTSPNIIHQWNKDMFGVFSYFNNAEIKAHLVKERTELVGVFGDYEDFTETAFKEPGKLTGSIGKGKGNKVNLGSAMKSYLRKKVPSIETAARDFLDKFNKEAEEALKELYKEVYNDAAIKMAKEKGDQRYFKDAQELANYLPEQQAKYKEYWNDLEDAKKAFDDVDEQYEKQEKYIDAVSKKALDPDLTLKEATKVRTDYKWKDSLKTYYSLLDKRQKLGDKVYEENIYFESVYGKTYMDRAGLINEHIEMVQSVRNRLNQLVEVPNFADSNLGFDMEDLDIGDEFEEEFENDEDENMASCARDGNGKCIKHTNGDTDGNKKPVSPVVGGAQPGQEHGGVQTTGTEGNKPESETPKSPETPEQTLPESADPGRVGGVGVHGA